ncbi:MAG: ribosome-associated translation inhibitor RaiA [Melioribacteraceae bacterium]|nr:ribosome-associated translation inhibitor RaiA [Melioribacteraceae bacterium]MCF8265422.1 ribosome-associated translation inhibitor RaiA [Melioribacteraceae bacterium]MCF8413648.1 ribosome-associated translation inhibitor RaiA [Melioribacteraceae bacterium]
MNINITSRKFTAKDSLKEFITDEVTGLQRFNDEIMEANIVLSFTHLKDSIKTAEIIMKVPGKTLTVSSDSDDFSKSISSAVSKMERQLKKIKTKQIDKKR